MNKYGPFLFSFLLYVSTPITQQATFNPEVSKSIMTKVIFITFLVLIVFQEGGCLGCISCLSATHEEASLCTTCRWPSFTAARQCPYSCEKASLSSQGLERHNIHVTPLLAHLSHTLRLFWEQLGLNLYWIRILHTSRTIWELNVSEIFSHK